jgi:hypothetical protein
MVRSDTRIPPSGSSATDAVPVDRESPIDNIDADKIVIQPTPRTTPGYYLAVDAELKQRLESAVQDDAEFWSFRGNAAREHGHGFFQYPAMTVPQMQRHLISAVRTIVPRLSSAYDPYLGSGTTMTEAMLQGLRFTGGDINPLAVLLCKVKVEAVSVGDLNEPATRVLSTARADGGTGWEIFFPNRRKWFQDQVAIELSRLRRAIRSEQESVIRRFLWVALAETVRLTSNSRTSTFKLHIRRSAEIVSRNISPITIFEEIVQRNIRSLTEFKRLLQKQRLLRHNHYSKPVVVALVDARNSMPKERRAHGHDLLITSPPYGDNTTTVPYGQHSYLPLQWIDVDDLPDGFDPICLSTTHEIDRRSIGGAKRAALEGARQIRQQSPALDRTLQQLGDQPRDRSIRVAAFYRDLAMTLDPILAALRRNAYMVWTVGNRRVGGISVPMDVILKELLVARGAVEVASIPRAIPSKRMAAKNSVTSTMRSEMILVLRKDTP